MYSSDELVDVNILSALFIIAAVCYENGVANILSILGLCAPHVISSSPFSLKNPAVPCR
jgi:hypothetical protein